jgi:perosamine synthetase
MLQFHCGLTKVVVAYGAEDPFEPCIGADFRPRRLTWGTACGDLPLATELTFMPLDARSASVENELLRGFKQAELPAAAAKIYPGKEPKIQSIRYRVSQPYISQAAVANVQEAVSKKDISSSSPWSARFAEKLQEFFAVPHAFPVSSGFSALVLAFLAAGLGPGDEVLLPSFTFVAVLNAITFVGATPVLVDSEGGGESGTVGGYNPTAEQFSQKQTSKTRALVTCHIYGECADLDALQALCREKKWLLIEDISEALGCKWNGRWVGTYGDLAISSLFANKIISSGDGGFVLTRHAEFARRAKQFMTHGGSFGDGQQRFAYARAGCNFKLSALPSALVVALVDDIPMLVEKRNEIASWYEQELRSLGVPGLTPMRLRRDGTDVPWLFSVHTADAQARDRLREHLAAHGVETRAFFLPLHVQPFRPAEPGFPEAEFLGATGVNLPTYFELTRSDVQAICRVIASCPQAGIPPAA